MKIQDKNFNKDKIFFTSDTHFSQIKVKFGTSRFYTNLSSSTFLGSLGARIENGIERNLNILLKYE